ncbi:MAG: DNRLRE domain-containing protein, partial [Gammaproteobacteria bacterium]
MVAVLVFLLVVAAAVALRGGEELGEIHVAAADAEARRLDYAAQAGLQRAIWMAENSACAGDFTIPATSLDADKYSATATGVGTTTAFTLPVDQDAWIREDNPTNNDGSNDDVHIRGEAGKLEQALVRFDLAALPAGARINSASIWFYVEGGGEHPEGAITLHRITADWAEMAVTWDSLNGSFDPAVLGTIPAQAAGGVWVQVNVTAQVQAWVNGQPNHGILLGTAAESVRAEYVSREGPSNQHPRLEVTVGTAPPAKLQIQATGTLASGMVQNLYRPNASVYQSPSEIVDQLDAAASADAEIWEQAPLNNYGDMAETWVSSDPTDTTRTLLRFDLDSIPPGAKILGATLFLERQSGSGLNEPIAAHRITQSWSEGLVSWLGREWFTPWNTPGGDFDPVAVATTLVGSGNQRYDWDITPLVQGWVDDSYPNHGVILVAGAAGILGHRFYTSDQGVLERRPGLEVSYACECGTVCMPPQGSGNILLVIGSSPFSPAPEDAAIRDALESLGYTVNMIQDDDSQGNYNAAFAANDVVFVSESVATNNIGTKLTGSPIGVITTDGRLNDELGISTNRTTPVADTVDVVDNSHFLTQVFPLTPIQFTTGAIQLEAVGGTVAPGAQVLAQVGGAGSIVAVDTGATLSTGGTAAGRRLLLPIGEASYQWGFDMLTGNGLIMLNRALAWGMNADVGSTGSVLLVVGNAGSPSSKDTGRQALMESWSFAVTMIDDGESQANFDAAAAAHDVVYVSGTIGGGTLADKLTGSPTPIVSEFPGKMDNFGISSSTSSTVSDDTFSSTDASHYISLPFSGGAATAFTSSLSMPVPGGTLAPDLQIAGDVSGTPALVTLDAGAQRWDATPAPARRAHLPFAAAETSELTADGGTIMR